MQESDHRNARTSHADYGNRGNAVNPPGSKGKMRFVSYVLAFAVTVYIVFYMPLPYFVQKPGLAAATSAMVKVKQPYKDEKGVLMMLTVRMSNTNMITYMKAKLNPNEEIVSKKALLQGETRKEYSERQQAVMQGSQTDAIQAAYRKAGIPYQIRHEGIVVLQTVKNLPADAILEPGDLITALDNQPIKDSSDLFRFMDGKKIGDTVKLTYSRNGHSQQARLKLGKLPPTAEDKAKGITAFRPGLGVEPADWQNAKADDPAKQVEIKAGDIGGPSAGLMFSLEIYNQLLPGDITKGYRIAGTGTINPEGTVGPIGGIQHKVVAAEREGAEIFFAPKDWYRKGYAPIKNASDAQAKAEKIGSKMKIVPVGTMADALRYLDKLPSKASRR